MNKGIIFVGCKSCFVDFEDQTCNDKKRIFPPFTFYKAEDSPSRFVVHGKDGRSFTISENREQYQIDGTPFDNFREFSEALEMKLCRYNENSPEILTALESLQNTLQILTLSQAGSIASIDNDAEAEIATTPPEVINFLPGTILTNQPADYTAATDGLTVTNAGLYLAISSLTPRRTLGGRTRVLELRTTIDGTPTSKINIFNIDNNSGPVDSQTIQFSEVINLTAGQKVGITSEQIDGPSNGVELIANEGRLILLKIG